MSLATKLDKIRHPAKLITPLGSYRLLDWMSDRLFVDLAFWGEMGYRMNIDAPKTFNEKLQWLKLYDRCPKYTGLVDKLKAKEIVGGIIGKEHIVPILGQWDDAEAIDFDLLPKRFVLKCNHDQGSVVLVQNKDELEREKVVNSLSRSLKRNLYYGTREYAYKNISPKVFAEEYLDNDIIDYKFYCFNGEPKFLYCGQGLTSDHSLKTDFYDLNWNLMPFYRTDYQRLGIIDRPALLGEMNDIAKILCRDTSFVRIDLFAVHSQVFFSEYTLCPASGFMPFVPKEYDRIVGDWLQLPIDNK